MPLLAWMCWSVALGCWPRYWRARAAGLAAGVTQLRSFVALATHEGVVAFR